MFAGEGWMGEILNAVRAHDGCKVAGAGFLAVLFPLPCIIEAGCVSFGNGGRSLTPIRACVGACWARVSMEAPGGGASVPSGRRPALPRPMRRRRGGAAISA